MKIRRIAALPSGMALGLMLLSPHLAAATFVVDNGGDVSDSDFTAGNFTLREAIEQANATAGADVIEFDASITTVVLTAALPSISEQVRIDGTVNASYVELEGVTNSVSGNGITVGTTSSGTEIYGLDINTFGSRGIEVSGANTTIGAPGKGNVLRGMGGPTIVLDPASSGGLVQANLIGVQRDGVTQQTNSGGVELWGSGHIIGGDTAAERNVISSATASNGINVLGGSGHVIQGNYVGTDPTGTLDWGNSGHGIYCQVAGTVIGGSNPGEGNLVSGNGLNGIQLSGVTSYAIRGNTIGLNASGNAALGNSSRGILILTTATNGIIDGNLIGSNAGHGAEVRGSGTTFSNNVVGLGADGVTDLGNSGYGLFADGATSIVISDNTLSGNDSYGIGISNAVGAMVQDNIIGLTTSGLAAAPNLGTGIHVYNASDNITITGNVISRNGIGGSGSNRYGLRVEGSTGGVIKNNKIGTDINGTTGFGNQRHGISIIAGSHTIGGLGSGEGNLVMGNGENGIEISSASGTNNSIEGNVASGSGGYGILISSATTATVRGNIVGLNSAGTAAYANANGIGLTGAGTFTIGGSTAAERNVISGNTTVGVVLTAGTSTLEGNYIGAGSDGATDLGNGGNGVTGSGVAGLSLTNNVISGNGGLGVQLSNCDNATIDGNIIGMTATGLASLSNSNTGLYLLSGSDGATITDNVVSSNGIGGSGSNRYGIRLETCASAVIRGNMVGADINGNGGFGNARHGISTVTNPATVGGALTGQGNIIRSNGETGIEVSSSTAGATIVGNTVADCGTYGIVLSGDGDKVAQGNQVLDSGIHGVSISGAGAISLLENSVSDSGTNGVSIAGSGVITAQDNVITGSGQYGISLGATGSDTITGNTFANNFAAILVGSGSNTIEDNQVTGGSFGIVFSDDSASLGNRIVRNTCSGISGISLGLGWWGPYSNDPLDADSGKANNYQNFPVIDPVTPGATQLTGVLASAASRSYRLDFYRNGDCHPSGYGEMEEWIGTVDVTTDGDGNAPFTIALPSNATLGQSFTATATDLTTNDTSSISRCVETETDPRPDLVTVARGSSSPTYGGTVDFDLTFDEPVTGLDASSLTLTESDSLTSSTIEAVTYPHGNALNMTRTMALSRPGTFDLSGRSFTVEFWAKRSSINSGNDMFVHCAVSNALRSYLHIGFNKYSFRFGFYNDDLDADTEWGIINEWQHWACTYDVATNQRRIYLNGVLVGEDTSGGPLVGAGTLTIGAAGQGGFEGKLDEVRIWDSALSQATIAANRFTPATGSESGLLALYQFDGFADLGVNADGADDVADGATGTYPLDVTVGSPTIAPADVPSQTITVSAQTGAFDGYLGLSIASPASVKDTMLFPLNTVGVSGETFLVIDNDPATDISLSDDAVEEGQPSGTTVGVLTATDPDTSFIAQTFSYALVSGVGDTDNGDFQIVGDELRTATSFPGSGSRSIRVAVTDNGTPTETFEKQFTITVSPTAVHDWMDLAD